MLAAIRARIEPPVVPPAPEVIEIDSSSDEEDMEDVDAEDVPTDAALTSIKDNEAMRSLSARSAKRGAPLCASGIASTTYTMYMPSMHDVMLQLALSRSKSSSFCFHRGSRTDSEPAFLALARVDSMQCCCQFGAYGMPPDGAHGTARPA